MELRKSIGKLQNVNPKKYISHCISMSSNITYPFQGRRRRGGHRSFFFGVFSLFFDGQDGSIQNYYIFSNA